MTPASIDIIDATFLGRLPSPVVESPSRWKPIAEKSLVDEGHGGTEPVPAARAFVDPGSLVDRLLLLVPDRWAAVADRIEAAAAVGQRVIAIVGGRRGEGRTTLVAGAAATLAARGRAVRCVAPAEMAGLHWGERSSITLVDAGIWFPSTAWRMERIAALARGYDAVILVRRADDPPRPAAGAALARLGVACLGEVETFSAS